MPRKKIDIAADSLGGKVGENPKDFGMVPHKYFRRFGRKVQTISIQCYKLANVLKHFFYFLLSQDIKGKGLVV